jgi:hypothetical protein
MSNYYSTINGNVLTFSNILADQNGFESIKARFERANEKGFDYSEWNIPALSNTKAYGFSEDEIMLQERYLLNNMLLIWEIAREQEVAKYA